MWGNIYKISLKLTTFVCQRHYNITSCKTFYVFAVSESSHRQTHSMLTLVSHVQDAEKDAEKDAAKAK